MKKFVKVLALVSMAATAVMSCNKKEQVIPEKEGVHEILFALGSGDATRALIDSDENGKFALWEGGDQLGSITTETTGVTAGFSSITPASGSDPATFMIYSNNGLAEGDKIYVWYPRTWTGEKDPTAVWFEIPSLQEYTSAGFDFDAMPMVTKEIVVDQNMVSGDLKTPVTTINMANMGSLLDFKVFSTNASYASEKVESVTFTADKAIAGVFEMDLTSVDPAVESTMEISSFLAEDTDSGVNAPSFSIKTDMGGATAIGTSKDNALDVYMVVAPGEYTGSVVVKTDVASYTFTISSAKTFVRSGLKAFGLDLNKGVRSDNPDYVVLPWESAEEGEGLTMSELDAIVGVSVNAGGDYSSGPCFVKLDGSGKNIVIKTDSQIGTVSVDVKGNGTDASSKIIISGSADGETWTEVQRFGLVNNQVITLNTTSVFAATDRFVKIEYYKSSGNAGIGRICISKANTDPYIFAEDIAVSALGVESGIATYEARNFEDDVIVPEGIGVTGCVSEAYAEDGEIIYCVDPNYTTLPVSGTIVLCSQSNPSVTKTINVTQAASVFEASSTDAMEFEWNDKTNSEEKTVTITSTFALTKTDNVVLSGTNADKFSVSLTPVSNSTDEYTLSVSVNEDNESEADYEAVMTVSRNDLEIAINLSQAKNNGGSKTDILTADCFAATNTTYTDFSNVSAGGKNHSSALYAGNSAMSTAGDIQLRSKNSNSGIVVTTSGGKAKSITFTIESGTNTIDVYGKNSAYSSAADLYNNSNKGTKIGSLSTSGTITVSSDYEYIGIRSNNGAVYITKIEIVWE